MYDKLLDAIIDHTMSGYLLWKKSKNIFNNDSTHNYECLLNDGSLVKIEINLDINLNFSYSNHVVLLNKELVDGRLFIHKNDTKKVTDVGNLVYQKFIQPNIVMKSKTQEEVIENIIGSIPSKEEIRDDKINQIISDKKNPDKNWYDKLFK